MKKYFLAFFLTFFSFAAYAQVPLCTTSVPNGPNYNVLCMSATPTGGNISLTNVGTATGGLSIPSPGISNLVVTGSFTATGLVTNADLANSSTTVNGVPCVLGSTCSIVAVASLVGGTSTISGTCSNGQVLYNNSGILACQAASGGGNVSNTGSPTNGQIAQWTNSTTIQGIATTGSGNAVLATSPTVTGLTVTGGGSVAGGLTVTGSFTATGLVTNADLANPSVTVNTVTCTLGSSCTITATAASVTPGTTLVSGGTTNQLLYDNGGTLGEVTKGNSCVYITSGAGAPSCSTTLPASLAATGLTATSLTVLTSFTATGLVTNADLVNAATTVNGVTCTLGSTCGLTAAAAVGDIMVATAATPTWGRLADVATGALLASGGVGVSPGWCTTCTVPNLTVSTSLTVTGTFTATGLVTNADLTNSATTVNGTSCALGSTCTVTAAAGTLTGTTLNSTVVTSSLTSVGTLAGLTSSDTISITGAATGGGNFISATSSNTGGTNSFVITNSGTISNAATVAQFLVGLNVGTGAYAQFLAAGGASPAAQFIARSGLTGGFIVGADAGPIKFLSVGSNVLDYAVTTAGTWTIANSVAMTGLPTSAGGGGLTVCVDTTGKLYKKASCP